MDSIRKLRLESIGQLAINVKDLDRATAFYRDTLGMVHLFSVGGRMSFFDCGGVRLMLALPEKPEFDHPASLIYYKVEDIDEAYKNLIEKEVRFEGPPCIVAPMPDHDLWMAFFRDSEDNPLVLMANKPKG